MEKRELMKRYEETTYLDDDPQALIQIIEYLKDCIQEYKTKAEAYDLIMSGGKKTPKEVANFLGNPIAMDGGGAWYEYKSKPLIGEGYCEDMWVSDLTGNDYVRLISVQIDFNGDWTTSLTLPDGWEEK